MSLFNTTAKDISKAKKEEIQINKIEETNFSKNYYPYRKDGAFNIKFVFQEFNLLDMENSATFDIIGKINKLLKKENVNDQVIIDRLTALKCLLFLSDGADYNYGREGSKELFTKFFSKDYLTNTKFKDNALSSIYFRLFEREKASSSNFINFIYDLKLERKDPNLEESKVIPYLYGFSLSEIDKGLRKKSIKDNKFSIEIYRENLKKFDKDPSKFLKVKDFIQPSKVSLTKFLAAFFKEAHAKDPNLAQSLSEKVHIELLKSSTNNLNVVEIKGDLIAYFYNNKNYYVKPNSDRGLNWLTANLGGGSGGTLASSCMRYNNCFPKIMFFANNPDTVSMLSIIDKNKKIKSRAILWTSLTGEKLMDRIYYSSEKSKVDLKAYAKQKGYIDIYDNFEDEFIEQNPKDFIVNVNLDASSNYPYFDSMREMDIKNNLISFYPGLIKKYVKENKKDAVIIPMPNGTHSPRAIDYHPNHFKIYIKGKKVESVNLKDIDNNTISNLRDYTFIDLPKRGFYLKNNLKKVIGFNKPLPIDYIKKLHFKYHSLKKFKYFSKETKTIKEYMTDKQFLTWSNILNSYILTQEAKYIPRYKTYFFKDNESKHILYKILKERTYKRLFSFSLVKLTKQGFEELKKEKLLKFANIDFQQVRPSRKFFIRPDNIHGDFVTIKNIPINIKYLQKIK